MSQLSILAERLEGRPIEEWLSWHVFNGLGRTTYLKKGMHSQGSHCGGDKGGQNHGAVSQNNDTHCHCPPCPALLPSLVGMPLCMMAAAKWANATIANWKRPGYFPADKHPEPFEKPYFCSYLASIHCCRKAHVSHGSCVRSASTCKCLSYKRVIVYYMSNAFAWAGRYDTSTMVYPGWILGIPVLLKCLQTPVF